MLLAHTSVSSLNSLLQPQRGPSTLLGASTEGSGSLSDKVEERPLPITMEHRARRKVDWEFMMLSLSSASPYK